jgi:hypothetical protein
MKLSQSEIPVRPRQRRQKGSLFEKCGAFYIRYYTTIGGVPKQKTKKICAKDEKHHSKTCKPVRLLKPAAEQVDSYKDIWERHLKTHFDRTKLEEYRSAIATAFLT